MHGLMTATHVGIVHQVVVQEREVVIGFQSDGLCHNPFRIILEQIVGQQHQHGSHTLAAQ